MSIKRYSEKEIEYVVRAFKMYVKKVVKHSAVDYVRKVNSVPVREVAFNEIADKNMSLSVYDSDIFFALNSENYALEDIISNEKIRLAIHKLSEDEKKILALSIEEYSTMEIAKIMKLSYQTIKNKKNIIRKKIKKMVGDKYENRN